MTASGEETPTVWVLTIDHHYGTDISVFRTEEGGRAALAEFCAEWWPEVADATEDPMPEDRGELIAQYFELAADEWFVLSEVEIDRKNHGPAV